MTASILLSATICIVVALFALWRAYLTLAAAMIAAVLGTVILFFGGLALGVSVGVCFFITSGLSRRRDRLEENKKENSRARRDLWQVLANGVILAGLAVLHGLGDASNMGVIAAFLGCVGAVAGDTWASEVGQVSKQQAWLLTSGKRVPAGTPGAVTVLGTCLTGLSGISATLIFILVSIVSSGASLSLTNTIVLGFAAMMGGALGAMADSLLGARFQAIYRSADGRLSDHPKTSRGTINHYIKGWRWLTNNRVNFANSVVGAASAFLIWSIAEHTIMH